MLAAEREQQQQQLGGVDQGIEAGGPKGSVEALQAAYDGCEARMSQVRAGADGPCKGGCIVMGGMRQVLR